MAPFPPEPYRDLFAAARRAGLHVTSHAGETDLSAPDHAIRRMIDFGLRVCINSDDPPMFRTDLGLEYEKAETKLKLSAKEIVETIRAGIDAAWLDDSVKRRWSSEWAVEMDAILGNQT